MTSHYYGLTDPGFASTWSYTNVNVATSSDASSNLEVRIDDGTCTPHQVATYLRRLADYAETLDPNVIAAGTLTFLT